MMVGGEGTLMQVSVDAETRQLSHVKSWMAHTDQINAIRAFPERSLMVTGSSDGTLIFWKFDPSCRNFDVVGKVAPFTNESDSKIYKIFCDSARNLIYASNDTFALNRMYIDFADWKIFEVPHLSISKSKISTLNHLPSQNIILLSHHSSNCLHQIDN